MYLLINDAFGPMQYCKRTNVRLGLCSDLIVYTCTVTVHTCAAVRVLLIVDTCTVTVHTCVAVHTMYCSAYVCCSTYDVLLFVRYKIVTHRHTDTEQVFN